MTVTIMTTFTYIYHNQCNKNKIHFTQSGRATRIHICEPMQKQCLVILTKGDFILHLLNYIIFSAFIGIIWGIV